MTPKRPLAQHARRAIFGMGFFAALLTVDAIASLKAGEVWRVVVDLAAIAATMLAWWLIERDIPADADAVADYAADLPQERLTGLRVYADHDRAQRSAEQP